MDNFTATKLVIKYQKYLNYVLTSCTTTKVELVMVYIDNMIKYGTNNYIYDIIIHKHKNISKLNKEHYETFWLYTEEYLHSSYLKKFVESYELYLYSIFTEITNHTIKFRLHISETSFDVIPEDMIINHICKYISLSDIYNLALCNKHKNTVIKNNKYYRNKINCWMLYTHMMNKSRDKTNTHSKENLLSLKNIKFIHDYSFNDVQQIYFLYHPSMKILSVKLNIHLEHAIVINKLVEYKKLNNDITKYYIHIFDEIKVLYNSVMIESLHTRDSISVIIYLFHIYLVICIIEKIPKCDIQDKINELFVTNSIKI